MINYFYSSFIRLSKKSYLSIFSFPMFWAFVFARAFYESEMSTKSSQLRTLLSPLQVQALVQKNNFRRTSTNFQLSKCEDKILYQQASKNQKMLKESYIQSSQKLLWRKNPWKQVISIAKYSWRGKSDYTEKMSLWHSSFPILILNSRWK